ARLPRHAENAVFERSHMAVARAPAFGKDHQTNTPVERGSRESPHSLQVGQPTVVRHRHIAEALHHPAVHGNLEMRFQLQPTHELRNRRVKDKGIEQIHVIDNEEAGPSGVEPCRPTNLKPNSRQPQDVAGEHALRAVVFSRIDENCQQHQDAAHDEEEDAAGGPAQHGSHHQVEFLHTRMSSADGKTSSVWHSRLNTSPSTITSTGPCRSNSTRRAARREARGWARSQPSEGVCSWGRTPSRPMVPQRTPSTRPSSVEARGEIIILPPVNLLLLKLRKRQRRRSNSASSSTRTGNLRRWRRAIQVNTPSR